MCRVEDLDVDWDGQTVIFRRTKSGKPRTVPLAPLVYDALLPLRGRKGPLLGFKQRYSLNQAIARACRRAGLPVMTSHKIGRHAFAARLLKQGKTLKEVQEAGGWSPKSLSMIGETYGHLERKAVDAAIRSADTDLAQLLKPGETIIKLRRVRNA